MMSTTAGRIFGGLTRAFSGRVIFNLNTTSTVRLNGVRSLALTSQRTAKSTDDNEEINPEPIKFSTSKASHRSWKVQQSLGSQEQRPWWKVLPISLLTISFLLWCVLREETDIDAKLEQHLFTHLPGFLQDEEEGENKPS
uniref:protein CCSMST1 isoform X2 n=1 Tax=Scatophagus argus TaxID=75038 RepID=UPI001ED85448|nr:protein CCSMST1 isoform X2 [Scatophagus argus]